MCITSNPSFNYTYSDVEQDTLYQSSTRNPYEVIQK